jgi:hypothetical protein
MLVKSKGLQVDSILSFLARVFMSGDVLAWVRVLVELFDFMMKASIAYVQTEQGQKEWSDFTDRFEVALNNDANEGTTTYTVQSEQPAKQESKRRFSVEE